MPTLSFPGNSEDESEAGFENLKISNSKSVLQNSGTKGHWAAMEKYLNALALRLSSSAESALVSFPKRASLAFFLASSSVLSALVVDDDDAGTPNLSALAFRFNSSAFFVPSEPFTAAATVPNL